MSYNNFNFVAPIYDQLASLVFGNKLLTAQSHFLNELPKGARVLFVGGGTGKLLKHPFFNSAKEVVYVDLSQNMLKEAKKNGKHLTQVEYLAQDFFNVEGKYDVIICNFFLDCFSDDLLRKAVNHLNELCKSKTKLVVTDFRKTDNKAHRVLTRLMILFFRVTSGLQAKKLDDIPLALNKHFTTESEALYKGHLVFSQILKPV